MPFPIHPHMLRHACGFANDGHDTRALQHYLGHKNIQQTVRYTAAIPGFAALMASKGVAFSPLSTSTRRVAACWLWEHPLCGLSRVSPYPHALTDAPLPAPPGPALLTHDDRRVQARARPEALKQLETVP